MFSKEESRRIRQEFWTTFGQEYPRKWLLYNTKVKEVSFKFYADRKKAMVCLDIEHVDVYDRIEQYERFESLKTILTTEFLPEVIYDEECYLEDSDKIISRLYIPYEEKFSIHNKKTWEAVYEFFNETMHTFEMFFLEYQDFIKIDKEEEN